jgi:hypothetical protein
MEVLMVKLYFNYRDILRAPRLALSFQRMWIQLIGMSAGYVSYLVFTYLSFLLAGSHLSATWAKYGLLPCLFNADMELVPWYAWIPYGIGALVLIFAFLITNTAVSRTVYMIAKGNNLYTWSEAFRFSFRKTMSIVLTPMSLIILVGLIAVGGLFIGFVAKLIPFVGELGISLLTVFWFLVALLLFFLFVIVFAAFILVPSIIATTDEDAFEAVFQTFSIVWNQPLRFFLCEALVVALSLISLGVFAIFVKKAILIMNAIFMTGMGFDFSNLSNNGQALLQSWLLAGQNIVEGVFKEVTPYLYFNRTFILIPSSDLPVSIIISSYIYALNLLFILGWVLAYGISTFTTGNTYLYLYLRKCKDGENLLERKDKEEEDEQEKESKSDSEVQIAEESPVQKSSASSGKKLKKDNTSLKDISVQVNKISKSKKKK